MRSTIFKPLFALVGVRYLFTRDTSLRFVTRTATVGLIISIVVLLVVQGVVAGFQRDLRDNILGLIPHVFLLKESGLDETLGERVKAQIDEVTSFAMVRQSVGLISSEDRVSQVQAIGIEREKVFKFSRLHDFLIEGTWDDFVPNSFGIYLGVGIAEELSVGLGDSVLLSLAEGQLTPIGLLPRQKKFKVKGLLQTHSTLDQHVAYVQRSDLARMLKVSKPSNAAYFRIEEPLDAIDVAFTVYGVAGVQGVELHSWEGVFGTLFNFLQQFKNLLFLLIALLLGVAVFNLVSSMVMLVHSRKEDVAVFRTLGGKSGFILGSFVVSGLMTACIGLVIGGLLAWLIGLLLPTLFDTLSDFLGVSLSEGFPLHRLSVAVSLMDWLQVFLLTIIASTLGSLYPAWRACQLNPSEILRNE